MKLYNSIGPNPKVVRMFLAEKHAEVPLVTIDLLGGENRGDAFAKVNPGGQTPALERDDGTVLTEITAICEYLDEVLPGPSLIGATAEERADTRMWTRRLDLNIVEPLIGGFRYSDGLQLFQSRMRCIPEAAAALKLIAQEKLAWLDGLVAGRSYLCGERFSLADIMFFCFLEFGGSVGQGVAPELANLTAIQERIKARPSAAA